MFNTSFSNKTQLKIYIFILLGRTWFNAFLALNRTDLTKTVEHTPLFIEENPWTVEHEFSHHKKQ
jgi:hypothetical protein